MKGIPFGSVASFRNGVNYSNGDAGPAVKIIGVGQFGSRSQFSDFSELETIPLPSVQEDDQLQDGDLLFVRSNGNKKLIGRCMLIDAPPEPVVHSGFTIRARLDRTKYLPPFVAAIFQTDAIHKQAHLEGTGTNISNLNQQVLSEIQLPDLCLEQQRAFLEQIGLWNSAIQTTEHLHQSLENRQQGLMQQLLTGRQRLKGFKGAWQTKRLGTFLTRLTRKNTEGCTRALTVSAQRGLVEQGSYFAKQMAAEDNEHYLLLQRGEFAYNRSAALGCPYGAIKRLDGFDEGIVSTLCLCFGITDPKAVHTDYLNAAFAAGLLNRQLRAIAHEGARSHGLLNVTSTDFFKMQLRLPPPPEQAAIAEVLNEAAEAVRLQRQQLQALQRQKRALLQRLLSGEPT